MAGEMIRQPNAFQKILHRFAMLRPVTAFFASWIHLLDNAILKWTNGKYAVTEFLGWPVIQITTMGAKSNQLRTLPLLGVFDQENIALIASSLGREHNPGWYYNLKAHPECDVYFKGRTQKYVAHEIIGEEYERYWQMAVSYYAGYEKYKKRATPRHIPVMLLEPKK